jgi:hypothetical protein
VCVCSLLVSVRNRHLAEEEEEHVRVSVLVYGRLYVYRAYQSVCVEREEHARVTWRRRRRSKPESIPFATIRSTASPPRAPTCSPTLLRPHTLVPEGLIH